MEAHDCTSISLLEGRIVVDRPELLRRSRATPQDVVILSGTLLEGFGNLYSDLDLYVVSEHLPTTIQDTSATLIVREDGRIRRLNETLTDSANVLLDVQYYTFRELDTLARSLSTLYSEARLTTRIYRKTLHPDDEDLIHKLLTGAVLQDGSGQFDAHTIYDGGEFCFLKYRNEVGGYEEFRDLVGSWTAGDLDSCLYNARGYLISQVSGMMFLAGNTNPRPKWFLRRLASLGVEYARLRDSIMTWMYGARHTDLQKRNAITTACDLIDTTYAHARKLLNTNARYYSVEDALALTEHEFVDRGIRDSDTLAEQQLRRSMFAVGEPPIVTQIQSHSREAFVAKSPSGISLTG